MRLIKEYPVSGEVECYANDWDNEKDEWHTYSGRLTISENSFKITNDYGDEHNLYLLPFTHFRLEPDEKIKNSHILHFELDICYSHNASPLMVFITGLNETQCSEINRICNILNKNIEPSYNNKIKLEEKICEYIIDNYKTELYNFIYNNTDDLLLNFDYIVLIYDNLMQNHFRRKIEDTDWNPEAMGPIMIDFNFNDRDFEIADNFLSNLDMLLNFLNPIIQQENEEDANISYPYIVWKSIFETAVNLYYDEFASKIDNILNSYEDLLCYLSGNAALNKSDLMMATYFCFKKDFIHKPFAEIYVDLEQDVKKCKINQKQNDFNASLKRNKKSVKKVLIEDIDLMTGTEFEEYVAEIFAKKGYYTTVTKTSGDQGIDVLAEKNGIKIGIQVKCYSGTVGNAAVQEATAGKKYYSCQKAMVITNSYFTQSAIELAKINDIILWDRNILKENM